MRITLDGGVTITGSISLNRFIQPPFSATFDTSVYLIPDTVDNEAVASGILGASTDAEPQKSLFATTTIDGRPLGDIDNNGDVNSFDAALYQQYYVLGSTTYADYIENVLHPYLLENSTTYSDYVYRSDPTQYAEIYLYSGSTTEYIDAIIDWGDGNATIISPELQDSEGYFYHEYSTSGTYEVTITGLVGYQLGIASQPALTSIGDFGDLDLQTAQFTNCDNLTSIPAYIPNTFTSMSLMFAGCSNLNDPNIRLWDTKNIQFLVQTFDSCDSFNINLSTWNTSNVTSMFKTFANATSFNNNISTWNTANVVNAAQMFDNAASFNQNLNSWDVSKVPSLYRMFANSAFNGNIIAWDTSNVSNLQQTFQYCTSFNQPIGNWNTSKVTTMNNTFANCSSFNGNIENWNTSNVTTFAYTFSNATNFTTNLHSWNTIATSNFVGMFNNVLSYNSDLGNWYTDRYPGNTEPTNFSTNASGWIQPKPPWTAGGLLIDFSPATAPQTFSFTATSSNGWVNWGDGSSSTFTSSASHSYSSTGNVQIQIKGVLPTFDTGTNSVNQYIYAIDSFGNMGVTNIYLGNCSNLTSVPNYFPGSIRAFRFGRTTGTCPINDANIVEWDVSNVNNMSNMFFNCTSFNQPIGNWNTSNVLTMSNIFQGATSFNSDITNWDVSNVGSFNNAFRDATSFNQDIGNWEVGQAGNMSFMFENASAFNQDLSDWCVINFTSEPGNFSYNTPGWVASKPNWGTCSLIPANAMIVQYNSSSTGNTTLARFDGATDISLSLLNGETFTIDDPSLTSQTLSKAYLESSTKTFYVTGNSESMSTGNRTIRVMQWGDIELRNYRCSTSINSFFTEIPDTLPATFNNGYQMLSGATNFTDGNVANWNVSNITNMSSMFADTDIDSFLDLSGWDMSNVTDTSYMFGGCNLFDSDISMWNTGNVANMRGMFYAATIFNQPIGTWDVSKVTDMSSMFMLTKNFQQDINDWDVSNVTNFANMFYGTANTGPTSVNGFTSNLANWNTSNATNMSNMFYQANNFSGNVETWDVSNVANMYRMFGYARKATDLVLDNWDVSKVANMQGMFYDAAGADSNLDLSNWNTSNVTNTREMFFGCINFDSNIASWDVSKVTDMTGMFYVAQSFNQPIGNWNTSNAIYGMSRMFELASSFNQPLKYWDVSNVDPNLGGLDDMFNGASSYNQDLSRWCVSQFASEPSGFSTGAVAWTEPKPVWGTCPQPDMYLTYNFPLPSGEVELTVEGNVDLIVYWGDGSVDTYNTNTVATHTYSSAGSYTVTLEGSVEKLAAENVHLTGVTSFGDLGLLDLSYAFANSPALTVMASNFPTTVTNLNSTFLNSGSINDSNIALWDVGNVTDMTALFNDATVFNQDLSNWCVTNIVAEPTDFATGSSLSLANYPVWGTCP